MLRKQMQFAGTLALAMLATAVVASAQRRLAPPQRPIRPPAIETPRPPAQRRPNQPTPQERQMLDLPSRWVERLQQMTPEQQRRFLDNNARFRDLPPEQQEQIRQRLDAFNRLTPEQQEQMRQRLEAFNRLTPEQRSYVRDTLLPAWQTLPPQRRQLLLRKLRNLRDLSDADRNAKLADEGFLNGLSPDERQMLHDLANLRIAGPE